MSNLNDKLITSNGQFWPTVTLVNESGAYVDASGGGGGGTGNVISSANSTVSLLGSGATFTGVWESVIDYTSIAVSVLGTNATDGVLWFDVRKTGSTIVNSVPFFKTDITGNATNIPSIWNIVESEFRIRYVNGTTAQLTEWFLETKYSNGQQAELLTTAGGDINTNTPVSTVKSLTAGANPLGAYINTPASGLAFSTTALLGNGATYSSGYLDARNFNQVQTQVLSDKNGTIVINFASDSVGSDIVRTLTIPYIGGSGFKMFSAPAFSPYVEYNFTCDEAGQADFYFDTKFLTTSLSGQVLGMEDFISSGMVANLGRNVQVGLTPAGTYTNLPATGLDSGNTTEIALGIGATFTGVWKDVSSYPGMIVSLSGTPASGGTLYLEFSLDGITASDGLGTSALLVDISTSTPRTVAKVAKYFRVRFVNGAVAQITFHLQTTLSTQRVDLTATTNQLLNDNEDVRLVRQVSDYNTERNSGLLNYQVSKRKFGRNEAVTNSSYATVWSYSANWIPAQVAQPVRIKAGGNANDTTAGTGAQTVEITFLNDSWIETVETLATNGALASLATTANAFRVLSCKVRNVGTYHGSNTGAIVIEQATSGNIMAHIPIGKGTSLQSVYTVPAGKTMYITDIFVSVGLADSCSIQLYEVSNADDFTTPFSANHNEWGVSDYSGSETFHQETYLKFDEKTDVWFEAIRITGSGSARVSVDFGFFLKNN